MTLPRFFGLVSSRLGRGVVVTVVAVLVVGGVSYAAGSSAAGSTVTLCAKKGSGSLTLSKNGACKRKTTPVVVGQTGPQGPPGNAAVVNPGPATAVQAYSASVDCTTNPGHFCAYLAYPWINYGAGLAPATYQQDAGGFVHLTGAVQPSNGSGAGTANTKAFYLPAGFRPTDGAHRYAVTNCSSASTSTSLVEIDTNGAVNVLVGGCADLSGVIFHP